MDRETLLPLSISAMLALCLHASVVMWPGLTLVNAQQTAAHLASPLPQPELKPQAPEPPEPKSEPKPEPKPRPEPKPEKKPKPIPKPKPEPAAAAIPPKPLEIGRDGEPIRSTVAWIPYDDFKELMAEQSLTIQPALQTQADPVPNAPIEMNPSTPKPTPAIVPLPSLAQQTKQTSPSSNIAPPKLTTDQNKTPTANNNNNQIEKTQPQPPVQTAAVSKPNPSPANSDAVVSRQNQQHDKPTLASTALQSQINEQPAAPVGSLNPDAANIVLPQGQDAPPLTSPTDKKARNTLKNKPDSGSEPENDSSIKTPPSSTTANISPPDDINQQALTPLKIPRQHDVTDPSAVETPPKKSPAASSDSKTADAPSDSVNPGEASATSKVSPPADTSSTKPPSTSSTAATNDSNELRPTSVPRSDRESIATQTTPMPDRVVMGKVLVSDGIEIKTVRPDIPVGTRYTAYPRNPIATIVFDKTGQVVRAQLVRSSGFADVDSPVLNSIYRWRATGKKLQDHKSDTFTIHRMKLLFVDEREPDKQTQEKSPDSDPASPASSKTTQSPDTTTNE